MFRTMRAIVVSFGALFVFSWSMFASLRGQLPTPDQLAFANLFALWLTIVGGLGIATLLGVHRQQLRSLATGEAHLGRPLELSRAAVRGHDATAAAVRRDLPTGLPNRLCFEESFAAALADPTCQPLAFIVLDFEECEASGAGERPAERDATLKAIGAVLSGDSGDKSTAFRLGSDEFVVLIANCDTTAAQHRVDALTKALAQKLPEPQPTASMGIAVYPDDAVSADDLRHKADLALTRAKANRRARAPSAAPTLVRAHSAAGAPGVPLATEIELGLRAGQFRLLYQPKMRARTDTIDGVEALIRWDHPALGPITPDCFVAKAERSGQILALTEWTLHQAVHDQKALAAAGHDMSVFVNISGCLLGDEGFDDRLLEIVGPATSRIGLEVTETAVIDKPGRALAQLRRFADAGIRIAIDDFGAGMSSLTYLKQMPAHELKIDRTFISGISRSHRDPLIVRSTIDLAHALGLEVTAEGVETLAALALLRVMGCDLVQGFLIARPMPLDDLLAFVDDHQGLAHVERPMIRGYAQSF